MYSYPLDQAANLALYTCLRAGRGLAEICFVLFDAAAWAAWVAEAERLCTPAATHAGETPPAVFGCDTCGFRVAGLRCRGTRASSARVSYTRESYSYRMSPESAAVRLPVPVSECGALLVASTDGQRMVCPHGCGEVSFRCNKDHPPMHARTDPRVIRPPFESIAEIHATLGRAPDDSPVATCGQCGHSVDGLLCVGERHDGVPLALPRNGFFERVWCAYVWSCEQGCARKPDQGGLYHQASLSCERCIRTGHDGRMSMLDYVERHGPPSN